MIYRTRGEHANHNTTDAVTIEIDILRNYRYWYQCCSYIDDFSSTLIVLIFWFTLMWVLWFPFYARAMERTKQLVSFSFKFVYIRTL